jgi:hypothetical protein
VLLAVVGVLGPAVMHYLAAGLQHRSAELYQRLQDALAKQYVNLLVACRAGAWDVSRTGPAAFDIWP